jgi:holo-[acyl-carrier protein] synthase
MIVGLGVDLVALDALSHEARKSAFTQAEQDEASASPRPEETLAGKFAVKEALMKALGAGIRQGVWFSQIEVLHQPSGALSIGLAGEAERHLEALGIVRVHATVSHTRGWAVAVVILEQEC